MFWIRTTKTPQKLLIIFCYFFFLYSTCIWIFWSMPIIGLISDIPPTIKSHSIICSNIYLSVCFLIFICWKLLTFKILFVIWILHIDDFICTFYFTTAVLATRGASIKNKRQKKKKWTVKIILKQRIGDSDLLNCRLLEPTHLFLCQ